MRREHHLYLGRGKRLTFTLPSSWTVLHYPEPEKKSPPLGVAEMALHALRFPEGIQSFREALAAAGKAGKRVAVIVDDGTRPTPVADILGVVLPELIGSGISRTDTTIVVALGTHAPLSEAGLRARLGEDVASHYKIVQHDAVHGDCVPVPVPGRAGTVRIHRKVVEADVRIGISSILPHPMAGFGGGPKLIMPGTTDFDSIVEHHMTLAIDPRSTYGEVEANPFHRDCMMVAKTVGLYFSINCVYDLQGRIAAIIGGTLEGAFGKAVEASRDKLGLEFKEKVDVTITSTYPHTHGLQLFKGLSGPRAITKDSGAILMLAPLVTPFPDEFLQVLQSIREESEGKAQAYAKARMSRGQLFAPGKSAEFNMAMYDLLHRAPIRTILVSPLISAYTATEIGLEYAATLREGLRALEKAYPKATVAVFPSGGLILPRMKSGHQL